VALRSRVKNRCGRAHRRPLASGQQTRADRQKTPGACGRQTRGGCRGRDGGVGRMGSVATTGGDAVHQDVTAVCRQDCGFISHVDRRRVVSHLAYGRKTRVGCVGPTHAGAGAESIDPHVDNDTRHANLLPRAMAIEIHLLPRSYVCDRRSSNADTASGGPRLFPKPSRVARGAGSTCRSTSCPPMSSRCSAFLLLLRETSRG